MATVDQLEKKLRDGLGHRRELNTINQYCWHLRTLAQDTGKTQWDRKDLLKYFDGLVQTKAPVSVKKYYYSLKSVFDTLDISFDMTERDLPRGLSRPRNRYVVSTEDIKVLINSTRESGDTYQQFYLCISTIYGLRRIEMSRLKPSDFDWKNHTMQVETAKHGNPRLHLIPEILIPLLKMDFEPVQAYALYPMWNSICARANYESKKGESWHAIRRALVTEFMALGMPEYQVLNFMRWSTVKNIIGHYYNPNPLKVDEDIFKQHPFLEMWR